MVKSDIVDNEFTDRDVSVAFSWRNWKIRITDPNFCTVRWVVSFLCTFGHEWLTYKCKPLHEGLADLLCKVPLFSDEGCVKLPGSALVKCGAFNGSVNVGLWSSRKVFESYSFEFDNIVRSYPAENQAVKYNRRNVEGNMVKFVLAATAFGPTQLQSILSFHLRLFKNFQCYRQFGHAFMLLQDQIGIEEKFGYFEVHWLSKFVLVP